MHTTLPRLLRTLVPMLAVALSAAIALAPTAAAHAQAATQAGAQESAAAPANPLSRVSRWTPPPLPAGKRPITQDSYDEWRTISGETLSPDGRWAIYTVSPVVGEGDVLARSTTATTEYRVPRGFTGRPQLMPSADSAARFAPAPAQVSADSRFAAFLIYPPRAEVERARLRRGTPPPRNTLGILSLADGNVTRIPSVRTFRLARNGGRYIAYQLEDTTARQAGGAAQGGGRDSSATRGARREFGNTVVLRELATGNEVRIAGVTSFAFDENESKLAYTVTARDSVGNGAYVRTLATGTVTTLLSGPGSHRGITFDRAGTQVVFLSDLGDSTAKPRLSVYYASLAPARGASVQARTIVPSSQAPDGLVISERGRLDFTRQGNAVLFSLGVVPMDSIPADSLVDKAVYDLWHWQESTLQPQQKLSAARDRNRTHLALYDLKSNKWQRLGSDSLTQVTVSDDGRRVLALNQVQYSIEQLWGEGGADVYLIDPATGKRTLVVAKARRGAQLSTGGNFVTWFDDGRWFCWNIATGKQVDLTGKIAGVRFDDEEFDSPDVRPAYGLGGWTKDDRRVLVYDRFDIWEVDPTGAVAPTNLTDGEGRRLGMVFRAINLDREERALDPARPLLLSADDTLTKASGFWRDRIGATAPPERIVMGDRNYAGLQKARNADQYLLTQSTYREFPDLWTGSALTSLTKISDANPQDAQYPRGTVELVSWLNTDGVPLRGLLYKPENFDPSRKYPVVVYYYEKLSDGLHNYVAPTGRNVVNPLVYNAEGYLVFMPDIVYTEGYPGPSAEKAIVPGVLSLIAKGFVDRDRIGITGQSWGGYQTAYLITATNMFAAAVPNATVVNMTSAYGGIRWGSGVARAFQYEHTQSRIAGSLWQNPERYVENSPLFKLDRVRTPVLFMANDNDGAVPWYQGIEFYVAMRRLQKEAYMVVYNGDEHNPTKRANQKDIDRKMREFFAVKLKGEAPPEWMVRGIPYLEKGRDQVKAGTAQMQPDGEGMGR
jgi:dipeptidyl aminopeptidase/acylaminoacyl peptidase